MAIYFLVRLLFAALSEASAELRSGLTVKVGAPISGDPITNGVASRRTVSPARGASLISASRENFSIRPRKSGWDSAKKRPKLLLVTEGTLDQISQDFRDVTDLVGFFTINVSDIVRRLRARAQTAGIDLSRPFFFLPGNPQFDQFLTQFKRERDARLRRLKRDKKKLAVARQRARHEGISALSRVATETAFANIMYTKSP